MYQTIHSTNVRCQHTDGAYSRLGSITFPAHLIVTSLALPHTVPTTGGTAGFVSTVETRVSAYETASRVNADW